MFFVCKQYYEKANVVTIVVLAILAAISLSAVIGEDGIIFQAKDTKSMIENETQYDSAQLASMQGDLRDNSIYSGIGLVPGTDLGGSSEGGEHGSGGSGGSGGTGGNNSAGPSGTNTNTGGSTGSLDGGNATPPVITVLSGEQIAASFFKTDVTIQIANRDKTQRIKYILTTDDATINASLYPSGMVKEIDIENGGTITFTKSTEYTITAYSYDVYGNKSNATTMWLKIDKNSTGTTNNGVTAEVTNGTEGNRGWYTSNVSIKVLGTQAGSVRMTYRVRGTAYSNGQIGPQEVVRGVVDTGEIEIANNTEFKITTDGEFEVMAYAYDSNNIRIAYMTNALQVKRDASRPIALNYHGEQVIGQGFKIEMTPEDLASGLADGTERFSYQYKLASEWLYQAEASENPSKLYSNLDAKETYDMQVIIKDKAGNMAATDIVSKPALWVSNNPTVGDHDGNGEHGERIYYGSNVEVSLIGQKQKEAKIDKVTYEITGNVTSEGSIDGNAYSPTNLPDSDEKEVQGTNTKKVFTITADGVYTIKVRTYLDSKVMTTNEIQLTIDRTAPLAPTFSIQTEATSGAETGYYKGNVTVKGTAPDTSSFKRIGYLVTGTARTNGAIQNKDGQTVKNLTAGTSYTIGEPELEIGNNEEFTITADGTWSVQGYVYDKVGHKSVISEATTFTKDTVGPNAPTVTISGTEGEATYYRSDLTISVASNGDTTSPMTNRVTWEVSGVPKTNGSIGGQSVTGNSSNTTNVTKTGSMTTSDTFTITADGEWTIKTYVYDYATNQSQVGQKVVTKDTEEPIVTSFITENIGSNTVEVTAVANGGTSGLATTGAYIFTRSGTTGEEIENTGTHTYSGLSMNTEYTFYVKAKDKAGNVTASESSYSGRTRNNPYSIGEVNNFEFNGVNGSDGSQQIFSLYPGKYKLEVWGAKGGSTDGGKGAYCSGTLSVNDIMSAYIFVGGSPGIDGSNSVAGGYNGGGAGCQEGYGTRGGGGGTDIRLRSSNLKARVIVAGGGGGGGGSAAGGVGGSGDGAWRDSSAYTNIVVKGGMGGQINSGGVGGQGSGGKTITWGNGSKYCVGTSGSSGSWYVGAGATLHYGGAGGGGWYGGGSGAGTEWPSGEGGGGGGGSNYVFSIGFKNYYPSGCLLTDDDLLIDIENYNGSQQFASPSGMQETGHAGNGYARITLLSYE